MAKQRGKAYQINSNNIGCPMHQSNDLDELIERATLLHKLFGGEYEIRTIQGAVVWKSKEGESCGKTLS